MKSAIRNPAKRDKFAILPRRGGAAIIHARVLDHEESSGDYKVLVLEASFIASAAKPGQFVHLRVPRLDDAVLRRPFSVFRADEKKLSILYRCVGRGTCAMSVITPGEEVSLIGPLGRGFPMDHTDTIPVLVAGGYGVAPIHFLASRLKVKGTIFIGGSTVHNVLCVEDFSALGWDVRVTTEDGSLGGKGLVTDALDSWLGERKASPAPEFYACGPDGMLKAVGDRAIAEGWKAWLSLDKHMGCGVGACLACVQKVRLNDGTETWARVCREGPVFESREIVWE